MELYIKLKKNAPGDPDNISLSEISSLLKEGLLNSEDLANFVSKEDLQKILSKFSSEESSRDKDGVYNVRMINVTSNPNLEERCKTPGTFYYDPINNIPRLRLKDGWVTLKFE